MLPLCKGVNLTRLLVWGPTAGSRGGAPVGGLGEEVPQQLKLIVKLHIIFALKYNK